MSNELDHRHLLGGLFEDAPTPQVPEEIDSPETEVRAAVVAVGPNGEPNVLSGELPPEVRTMLVGLGLIAPEKQEEKNIKVRVQIVTDGVGVEAEVDLDVEHAEAHGLTFREALIYTAAVASREVIGQADAVTSRFF